MEAKLPHGPAAVLAALHFCAPAPKALAELSETEWRDVIGFTDRSGLTLILRSVARHYFPQWLRERTDRDLDKNRQRLRRTQGLYHALDERLRAAGIDYVALKGLTQCLHFPTPADLRVQFDVDLFVPPENVRRAGETIQAIGSNPSA